METDADSWSIASPETGGFRLYHPAAMARARCLRRVPLRGAGTCLDAADDRRNSRRARNCSGEAGVVPSVLFLVTMAGSLLVVQTGGLFLQDAENLSVDPRRGCGQTGDHAQATGPTILITAEDAILFPLARVM